MGNCCCGLVMDSKDGDVHFYQCFPSGDYEDIQDFKSHHPWGITRDLGVFTLNGECSGGCGGVRYYQDSRGVTRIETPIACRYPYPRYV